MQQVTYITIPCLSTFKHSTFKAIKRCKQIAYFEDLGNPKQLLSRVAEQIYLTFLFSNFPTYILFTKLHTSFRQVWSLNLLVRLNLKCEFWNQIALFFWKEKQYFSMQKYLLMQSAREVNMLEIYSFWTIQYRDKLLDNSAKIMDREPNPHTVRLRSIIW